MAQTTKKIQQYKTDAVTKLKEHFAAAPDLIFSDFRGLTLPADDRPSREAHGEGHRLPGGAQHVSRASP